MHDALPETHTVTTPTITEPTELDQLCQRLESADLIGIDTEFVSEDTFFPELCLIKSPRTTNVR